MAYSQAVKFIDPEGNPYGIPKAGGKPRVSSTPYTYDIAKGNVPNHRPIRIHGMNPDVDNVREGLIYGGGTYVFPPAAAQMEVVSTNASDSLAGTGVQKIEIHWLDNLYVEYDEIITLNGATPVLTAATNILRINGMHSVQVGSGGVAAGDIIIRPVGGGSTYGIIPAGLNQLIQAVYTVPKDKRMFITDWTVGAGNAAGGRYCEFTFRATAHDDEGTIEYLAGIFHVWGLIAAQDANVQQFFTLPIKFPQKTDIKISAISDAATANAVCSGCIEGWIEDEPIP